jgi:hypothetical protein
LKENNKTTTILETIKDAVLKTDGDLREAQRQLFSELNEIQQYHDDLVKLSDLMVEQKEKEINSHDAFDAIVDWQDRYSDTPFDLPRFDNMDKKKPKLIVETWKSLCEYIEETIDDTTKIFFILWNSSDDILEKFRFPMMDKLNQEVPSTLMIAEAEWGRYEIKHAIEQPNQINKEILNNHLIKLVKLETVDDSYTKKVHGDLEQGVAINIYHGEVQIERMQLSKVE